MSEGPELLVIGIDAFSSHFFESYLKEYDEWQWLYQEIEDGLAFKETLWSVGLTHVDNPQEHPPHTGPEWSNMYTGVTPDDHGVTDYGWREEQLDYDNLEKKTVFEQLDQLGYTQAIYSLPVTWPAPQIENGWAISGFPSPLGHEKAFHVGAEADVSPDIIEDCSKKQPRNIIQVKDQMPRSDTRALAPWEEALKDEGEFDTVIQKMLEIERSKRSDFLQIIDQTRPDIAYFGTHGIDKAGHIEGLEPEGRMTQAMYGEMGEIVESLIEEVQPETWLLVSDHGFKLHHKAHDHKGVMISNRDITTNAENVDWYTKDVAWKICSLLDIDPAWIGQDRDPSLDSNEEEQVKKKLEELGYV